MRMRHKKNLEPRLEEVREYFIPAVAEDLNYANAGKEQHFFDFAELFGREAPVYLEIGSGKGQFICELALQHPENNYIAVEKVSDVIVMGAEKVKKAGLTNVLFARCGAEYLPSFIPPHSIAGIYLNFSPPYPKNRHEAHRLTNRRFLDIYRDLLAPGAEIHQKTDNMHYFEYSIAEFSQAGYALKNISLDLHNSDFEGNIMTEYETRFVGLGQPIYRLEAYLPEE
ncbi:MAG: tRNA (guanosine(46)-N7)-methyltransferase TrmB [Clostridia bacterium]|nr:tRNA (guanosine(46)-N7)-methyltransferase TrmB [Clostridia bacterium]